MCRKKIDDDFKECMDRAATARGQAEDVIGPTRRAKYLRLERSWIRLARSYEFAQRLNGSRPKPNSANIIVWHHRILEVYYSPKFDEERNDPRTVSLICYGRYEVRLIELPGKLQTGTKQLWLELFDHYHQSTIDSYGGRNLVDITAAAETLCSKAEDLSKSTD